MASETFRKALEGRASSPLSGMAALALLEVAAMRNTADVAPVDAATLLQSLASGPTWDGPVAVARALAEAQATPETALDQLIPDFAARLGEDWMADRASFAQVSLISARLQALAWHYIEPLSDSLDLPDDGPGILLIVPEGETHTLGAVLAIGRLRREGLDAVSLFGEPDADVISAAAERFFAVIGISTSGRGGLARLEPLVAGLRENSPQSKIAIGGPVVEFGPELTRQLAPDLCNPSPLMLASILSTHAQSGSSLTHVGGADPSKQAPA